MGYSFSDKYFGFKNIQSLTLQGGLSFRLFLKYYSNLSSTRKRKSSEVLNTLFIMPFNL